MENIEYIKNVESFLSYWQALVGSIIGASAPFLLWWFTEIYRRRKDNRQFLYYLQRIIVDQINSLVDVKKTTEDFIDLKLNVLIANIESNPNGVYSVNTAFFPLFSVRPIPDDINRTSSGSGYIDNKVAKVYALSKDFPHIIDDIRLQLKDTIERNEKIAFSRVNSSEAQKNQFKQNIITYREMIKDDLIDKNFPLFLKKLAETLVAIQYKTKTNSFIWKIKFDPFWKFFYTKETYVKARENIIEDMDKYFMKETEKILVSIDSQE